MKPVSSNSFDKEAATLFAAISQNAMIFAKVDISIEIFGEKLGIKKDLEAQAGPLISYTGTCNPT